MHQALVAQTVKLQFLGREDPLEKEMATHSSTLPGKSHGRRSLVGCSPWGRYESDTTERLHFHMHQHSCASIIYADLFNSQNKATGWV